MTSFDPTAIERLGWRQAAVLGEALALKARSLVPAGVKVGDTDWLVVVSHDCDVLNGQLEKEPHVEVMRAAVLAQQAPERAQTGGRSPRVLQLQIDDENGRVVLACRVHDRWSVPREWLAEESPRTFLPEKTKRLIAEWLAKRYIRSAYPTAFDGRWRSKMKEWVRLLERYSERTQGVYLRLSTLDELEPAVAYGCYFLIAVLPERRGDHDSARQCAAMEREIAAFWHQFSPAIECAGVEVLGTDRITLADLDGYQRFDADWVSFADDSPTTPLVVDLRS